MTTANATRPRQETQTQALVRVIGSRIRYLREAARMSQSGLARRAHVEQSAISRLESAKLSDIHLGTVAGLAAALGVELAFLLCDIEADVRTGRH